MEWNPSPVIDSTDTQKQVPSSKYNEELVTAAQDSLVKFHNLSDSLKDTMVLSRPYTIMRSMHQTSSCLRTVVPVWKARYVKYDTRDYVL